MRVTIGKITYARENQAMVSFIKTAALALAISTALTAIYALIYWAAVREL